MDASVDTNNTDCITKGSYSEDSLMDKIMIETAQEFIAEMEAVEAKKKASSEGNPLNVNALPNESTEGSVVNSIFIVNQDGQAQGNMSNRLDNEATIVPCIKFEQIFINSNNAEQNYIKEETIESNDDTDIFSDIRTAEIILNEGIRIESKSSDKRPSSGESETANCLQEPKKKKIPINIKQCEYCPKQFRKEKNLKKHTKLHSMDSPYVCEVCGFRFPSQFSLSFHSRMHKERYTCGFCYQKFVKMEDMQDHFQEEHSE